MPFVNSRKNGYTSDHQVSNETVHQFLNQFKVPVSKEERDSLDAEITECEILKTIFFIIT